ncbi:hypothetical protein RYX36_025848, partial [Vicia faba]
VEAYQTTICVEGRKLHNIDKQWKMEREIRGLHLRLVRINQSSPEDFLGYYSSNEISGSCCSSFVVQRNPVERIFTERERRRDGEQKINGGGTSSLLIRG